MRRVTSHRSIIRYLLEEQVIIGRSILAGGSRRCHAWRVQPLTQWPLVQSSARPQVYINGVSVSVPEI